MSIINNLPFNKVGIKVYNEHTYTATGAIYQSHTFSRDYDLVVIFALQIDTDNNKDNYLKVFSTDKGAQVNSTAATSQRNMIDDMWEPLKINGGTAGATEFSNEIDQNTLLLQGSSNPYSFSRTCYKEDVKQGENIYMYSGHKGAFWIIGITYK